MSFDSSDPKERSAARVVMLQRDDFREIYCPFELLRERESKRLVVIDRRSKSSEMAISDDETVDSLLAKGRMSDLWRGSWQPQARLITKDAIYQSPASPDAERKTAFLKHLVKPGDILVIAFVD